MLTQTIPPHPNPNCCVASNMCSCATNVNTSHPTPPQPRVTMYVAANPRGNLRDRRAGKRTFCSVYNGRNTLARARRYVRPEPKTNCFLANLNLVMKFNSMIVPFLAGFEIKTMVSPGSYVRTDFVEPLYDQDHRHIFVGTTDATMVLH